MTTDFEVRTIGDLRRLLELATLLGLADDNLVIMSRDEEGNGYSPLAAATSDSVYLASSTYAGEIDHWDADDVEDLGEDRLDYEEWLAEQLEAGARKCLVLWPLN